MQYNWDWGILFRDPYIWWLVDGLKWTLMIAMCAWVLAFVLGSALGIMRTSINPYLRLIGTTYVEIFRNIPLLVQLFLWYFVFPELLPEEAGRWVKREMPLPGFTTTVWALGLYTASRY
jgi:glutamate/aspartate transport system permease protein